MKVDLVLFKKNGAARVFPTPRSATIIGRSQDCDLCIPLMVVSRKHCQLNQDQQTLTLTDLGSRNGTFLNGRRVDQAQVNAGDQIQIGPILFGIQIDDQPPTTAQQTEQTSLHQQRQTIEQANAFADADNLDDVGTLIEQSSHELVDDIAEDQIAQ